MILFALVIAAVIAVDQISKILVVQNMEELESVDLIPHVFRLTYIHNEGAAFGMLADHRWVFMVISTIALLALTVYLYRSRKDSKWFTIPLSLIIGGGVANMIDRIRLNYVVDFCDFYLFPFWKWIFNIADACVVVGAMIIIVYLLIRLIREFRKKGAQGTGDAQNAPTEPIPAAGPESDAGEETYADAQPSETEEPGPESESGSEPETEEEKKQPEDGPAGEDPEDPEQDA